jgi:hypothetical protein
LFDPRFEGSNPADDDGFKVNKNPLHNFLQRRSEAVCPMFTAAEYEKFTAIFRQDSPASIPGVSAGSFQTALVDESGIIITQMGKAQ